MMEPKKTVYYKDLLHDDFADNGFNEKPLPSNYKYYNKCLFYKLISGLFYYVIAVPVLFIFSKLMYHFKVKGFRRIRALRYGKNGYFVYGNHTTGCDAMFAPSTFALPKRTYFVCSQAAMSKAIGRPFEKALGAIPLPNDNEMAKEFDNTIEKRYKEGNVILIFPEAHIWPYCTMIRPFPDNSFTYPARMNAPVVAICTTFEKRKLFPNGKPRAVIHISEPIYPDMSKPLGERTHLLREAVYGFMVETASSLDNVEYWKYIKKEEKEEI